MRAHDGHMDSLRVDMKKLRDEFEPEPAQPKYRVNEAGIGYRPRMPS